jgi:Ca-activated chloride channel family protein
MIFATPSALWLLPVVLALVWYRVRFGRRADPALGYSFLADLRGLESPAALFWLRVRPWLRGGALVLLVLALARPLQGLRNDERDIQATDIMICLDVSYSMRAEDFAPKNRIEIAKEAAARFIAKRDHDRIGVAVFGEFAMTICPLTVDYNALGGLLADVAIGEVPPNRTAIGDGLATCVERLKNTASKSKVIIILSDGGNNAGSVDPVTAAKAAAAYGIRIYAIGAGAVGGGTMTVQNPVFGARRVRVADDLDEETLTKISTATGGQYFRATDTQGLFRIFGEIDRLEKTEVKVKTFTEYLEVFEWLLVPGLLLLGAELVIGDLVLKAVP